MYGSQTPMYGGSRTPMYGSQTPLHDGELAVTLTCKCIQVIVFLLLFASCLCSNVLTVSHGAALHGVAILCLLDRILCLGI